VLSSAVGIAVTDGCLGADTLVDFLAGRADPPQRARIEQHASRCSECRAVLSSLVRSGTPPIGRTAAPELDRVLAPGTPVGRYLIAHKLGAGGMGVVYAARDPELDRMVAIKLLHGDGDRHMQERLRREAQAMAQLAHPNVVAVHDVGTFEGHVFVAMEYVAGETLAHWLSTPRAPREILEVHRAAGRGLAAAHAAGIVHRDFKPENVLIGRDGRPRVGDFGLARAAGTADTTDTLEVPAPGTLGSGSPSPLASPHAATEPADLTIPGTVLGTPYYMAPELYRGEEANARSDQFSFCVALFTALHGERPFDGATFDRLGANVCAGRLREPRTAVRVPRRIRAAIQRGLAVDPAARFATLDGLLDELAPPASRRTRAMAALGAALILGLAVTAWLLARSAATSADERCTGAGAAFASAWNPGRRDAIAAAFTATRTPYAAAALDRVTTALDDYAARWIQAHTAACRATRILGEQTEAMLDLRMTCLERRRQEAAALADTLAAADTAGVARSVSAAVGLVDVATCADVVALRQVVAPPADPAARAQLAALTPRLADARARYETGAFARALELVRPVAATARVLAYRPFEAEAELLQGQLEREAGDVAHAEATLETAVWAAEAGRHDEVAARAWSTLVFLVGYDKAEYARGLALVPRATAAIARLGGNPDIEATLERALGAIDADQSKLDTAVAHFEKAVALAERAFGATHPGVARALDNLGMAVMARGDGNRAIALHERALRIYEPLLGPQHPTVAQALHNLGNAHAAVDNDRLAEQELRRALAIREAALGPDHPDIAANLTDLARVVRHLGNIEDALALDRRAVAMGEKAFGAEHPVLAGQLVALGIDLGRASRPVEADAALRRAEAIFTRLHGPDHVEVMRVLVARGDVLMGQARWQDAATLYERAIPPLAKSEGGGDALPSAQINLGRARVELHQAAQALAPLEQLASKPDGLSPDNRAALEFTLARALWDSGGDRTRARTLASGALTRIQDRAGASRDDVAQMQRWLASHR
jgi:tetratricopeptide (TPR) repeat protein/predicted Ser/Thr protein kinase